MKKSMLLALVFTTVLGGVLGCSNVEKTNGLSDKEIVTAYAVDEYGEGNYDVVIYENTDDEYINYSIKSDDIHKTGFMLREYYGYLYGEN